ncbi:MAG: alpha/beta hydrolase fold protein [Ramlibacter sp.]|nr:alpha/beta hydrolase fold protein [Ramlibacter sp.]
MTTLSPLEQDLPTEALRVLGLSTRLTTPCGDGDLVWHAWGDGEPLVLLHGGSGSWTHWLRNVEALAAAGRRVLVPDLPGFGDSARPPEGQDADSVAPALAGSLRQLAGPGPFDLVGFSFGGLTGTLLAAGQPELARQLVLVGAPGLGLRSKRLPLTAWRGFTDRQQQREAHRANLAMLMLADASLVDEQAVDLQAANVPRDRMHRRKLAMTDLLLQTLPSLQCPVSAIYGTEDALYRETRDQIEPLLRRAPCFRQLVFIPGAGHWVQYEAPAAFDAALLQLLRP